MVVYAAAADVSVGRMFLAGVIPGLIAGRHADDRRSTSPPDVQRASASQPWAGWGHAQGAVSCREPPQCWGLLLIVIILGGIYGGIFTPTEAAAVAAVIRLPHFANFVYRDMGPSADGKAGAVPCSPARQTKRAVHGSRVHPGHQTHPASRPAS